MSISYRRYQILLPLRFNDGSLVPRRLLTETVSELRQKFGAVSCETQIIEGQWEHAGEVYQDELVRIFVDVEDTSETRNFFTEFREALKTRFNQVAIWMTSYSIDVH